VVAVAAGGQHSLYLKSDGTLWAMGRNNYGQLGAGNVGNQSSPVAVPGMSLANVISGCNANHTLAVGLPLPALITSQPTNETALAGSHVIFRVMANGFAPLAYQWCFNGTNLNGARQSNYNLNGVTTNNAGNYTVVVSNCAGCVTSSVAALMVLLPPSITTQPASQTVINGSNATFNVTAGGTAPLAYQWYFNGTSLSGATVNGTSLSGATAENYSLTGVTTNNAGNYTVVVTNLYGSVTSSMASLAVITLPPGYNQISSQLLSAGDMRLSFVGIAGEKYALDRSFSLSPADWVPQATNPADAGGALVFTNTPDPATNNFWRVRSVP
jgi:uncharacterized protein YjbI with pentapeptide repeats